MGKRRDDKELEPLEDEDLSNIMPLSEMVPYLEDVTERQLYRWAENKRNNGFPEPYEVLGKYKLYELDKVARWVKLFRIATKNMGRRIGGK